MSPASASVAFQAISRGHPADLCSGLESMGVQLNIEAVSLDGWSYSSITPSACISSSLKNPSLASSIRKARLMKLEGSSPLALETFTRSARSLLVRRMLKFSVNLSRVSGSKR